MNNSVEYRLNQASEMDVFDHLSRCDGDFVPRLSDRVELSAYAKKIVTNTMRFEAWADGVLVGLVAAYCNDRQNRIAYVTSVSVMKEWTGKGVATCLINQCIGHAKLSGMQRISLEVARDNALAVELYKKSGFITQGINGLFVSMDLILKETGDDMNSARDYNIEMKDTNDHRYAYSFDYDVMQPYMIKSFKPFFIKGSLLELGSFKGEFTRKFLDYFDDITCVEASGLAIMEAKSRLGDKVKYFNTVFEKIVLPKRYENIVLTHVLEHLDDPVLVLKRINDEWLSKNGRLFLVCPNANAPSRQIAVKMGLISHNSAISSAEIEHGHRIIYTLDTLERDARAAGLRVVLRSGIFFKAFANFQWDRLLATDIISPEYLEGCYQLGQIYPDLCASIFLLCEKGSC